MSSVSPGQSVIRTPDQRLRVFVSSTLGELAEERRAVSRAISALRLTPVLFELGARPHPPRELYRAYLAQSDIFVGVYWQRYGWIGPGMEVSGLEDELELARGLPRLLYVKVPAPDREPRLVELLTRLTETGSDSYRTFGSPAELSRLARDDLAVLLSERFAATRTSSGPAGTVASVPTPRRGARPLPVGRTTLFGRDAAINEVAELVGRPGVRLVTLTGPGGIGKTRLAMAVGERLVERFDAGVAFVPLAAVSDPQLVVPAIGRAVGADLAGAVLPLEGLIEHFGEGRWLIILDNMEQLLDAAGDLDELLGRCPGLVIVATSRTALRLRAEREYPVPPLRLPADTGDEPFDVQASTPAVALFVDRARAVRYDFALTPANVAAVVEICRRLDGVPLAIELAAARTRLLDADSLLRRLASSMDALGTGSVDLPARQRSLRATVDWSVSLLDDAERSLLETAAVFVDGWTLEAIADVSGLGEDRALELSEELARHSLVHVDTTALSSRYRLLETIREIIAERLAARPDVADVERRHAEHFRVLAEQADRPLRGAGYREWIERLDADAGNLAAAVRWYLAHDSAPLPHLFWILWLFWAVSDRLRESRPWVEQLLPAADSLDVHARAELLSTVAAIANETGDDTATLAACDQLVMLLDQIDDPSLHAVAQLIIAFDSPIVDDYEGALAASQTSLAQLRGQDEPFWTALALNFLGSTEIAVGRYDDAVGHLSEMRALSERLDNTWLTALSMVQLGIVDIAQERLEDARSLLDSGLDLSLDSNASNVVAFYLAAYAWLTLKEGHPERAVLIAGAAEGLRRRTGVRLWPVLRRGEANLKARVRDALGADRFDEVFATGSRLNRQDAVALVRGRPMSPHETST